MQIFNYLGERRIGILASEPDQRRISRNFQEPSSERESIDCMIEIETGEPSKIIKNDKYPYLWIKENNDHHCKGIDFFRYGTRIQSIWEISDSRFLIKSYLEANEGGALRCFKRFYFKQACSAYKSLIHGSLISINGRGYLIAGKCRSGKTTLAVNFFEELNANLISDGNTLISFPKNILLGEYLPRPIHLRFSTIVDSERLSPLIEGLELCEATQPFDIEALHRIIEKRAFYVDAGLNISRQKFAEIEGIQTLPSSKIEGIIFPSYCEKKRPLIKKIAPNKALNLLKEREFPKDIAIGLIQKQTEIIPPRSTKIEESWISELSLLSLSFAGKKHLSRSLLEDLLK